MTKAKALAWALKKGHITQEQHDSAVSKETIKEAYKAKSKSQKDKMTKSDMQELIDSLTS